MNDSISAWARDSLGMTDIFSGLFADAILVFALLVICLLVDTLTKKLLLRSLALMIEKSKLKWDDAFLRHKVFYRMAHTVPALIVYLLAPILFYGETLLIRTLKNGALIYITIVGVLAVNAFLDALHNIYKSTKLSEKFAIKSFVQAGKVAAFIVGGLMLLSILTTKTPLYFLSGIGALTAVLMLIFRDAILGLVAGIQISANDMVKEGDWIEMPQFGADGDVLDVSLTTVKVQNFDKTITTVPTYALISQSFKNWRGMQESGGRRIKRSINIDMNSVRFCDERMIEKYRSIQILKEYLDRKLEELDNYNAKNEIDPSYIVNGRRLTNVGTFRAYVTEYIRRHPMINTEMTFMVRQLQPGRDGLPMEIYGFSTEKRWVNYEGIQSDIFDHIIAALPHFDLRVFQDPTGADFSQAFGSGRKTEE